MKPVEDATLLKDCREFRDGILNCMRYGGKSQGMCFAISTALGGWLSWTHNLTCTLVEADFGFSNHVWLQLPDGRIIDATADQFKRAKLPAVYIGPLPSIYERWMKRAALAQPAGGDAK